MLAFVQEEQMAGHFAHYNLLYSNRSGPLGIERTRSPNINTHNTFVAPHFAGMMDFESLREAC